MSIASAIQNAQQKVADAYTAISNKGGTLPATQNLSNMPTAIGSIQTGGTIDTLNVTPTTSAQTITASGGVDGYSPVNVSAVTSSIDANIQPENIKKDVVILGTTGTFEGGGGGGTDGSFRAVVNGVFKVPEAGDNFEFKLPSNATDLGDYAMYYAFYVNYSGSKGLISADLSSLTTISGAYGLSSAFYNCTSLTSVDLSNLTTISTNFGISSAFEGCTSLTSINLSSLIQGYLRSTFTNCTSLTSVDLSSVSELNVSYAIRNAFDGCTSLSSLSFPALTSTSFGSYTNQFRYMLSGVTGCTVHFPSNLQSVIGSWSDVTGGFGGTNTTVLFDLPATT